MKLKNQILKILAIVLLLNGVACISNDSKVASTNPLPDPFPDQSTEAPVADLVADWTLHAAVTNAEDNEYCNSIADSLADGKTVSLRVTDTGECANTNPVESVVDAKEITETCKAAADNLIYEFEGDFASEGCKVKNVEILNVTLQEDGTLAGEVTGYASSSGCVNEDGTDAVSGECFYTGDVTGDLSDAINTIDADSDGFTADVDCNDHDATINPDAVEIVGNGIDENCDGADLTTAGADTDSDGFTADVDCNDENAAIHPHAVEILDNGIDEDCSGADLLSTDDTDGDGFTADQDCDDTAKTIFPGAPEIANNGVDEDCDGEDLVTETAVDADADGFTSDEDCNDNDAGVNPDAEDIANNGIDEDCKGGDFITDDGECEDGDASCDPDLDNDGLCDVAANCEENAIDPDGSVKNDWHWVDYTASLNTGNGGFADYKFIDGTKDASGEIFVFGVVEGFKRQEMRYTFCAGTHQSAMIGICINASASSAGSSRTVSRTFGESFTSAQEKNLW